MKKMLNKIQDLGKKAAQFKQVLESAPARAAELRESVLLTAGQLQQLRQEVQGAATGLRADNEDKLTQALREINDSSDILREAGYELFGVDMELSPVHRLIVHLEKVGDSGEHTLRSLISAHAGRPTLSALLSSLTKAEHLATKVDLTHLHYRGLVIHVGPTPSVRLCWSAAEEIEAVATGKPVKLAPEPPAATPPPLPTPQSSFFEPRHNLPAHPPAPSIVPTSAPTAPAPAASPAPPPAPAPAAEPKTLVAGGWKRESLERFKKMPDVSKYRR